MFQPDLRVQSLKTRLKAILVLEDGTLIYGQGFGAQTTLKGELVFNTGHTGYQEALTDPSYRGQILMMTYPLIGNYGINKYSWESEQIQVKGLVIREVCEIPIHRESYQTISEFLESQHIPGIAGIDTRMLTIKTRHYGTMKAVLTTYSEENISKINEADLLQEAATMESPERSNLVAETTCPRNIIHQSVTDSRNGLKVVVIDCGVKASIIRELTKRGCLVIRVPYHITAEEIRELNPHGILISNGPGDPAHPEIVNHTVRTIREIVTQYPIMGICLGHQILALVFGARTYKLKFGHRGANQPVKDLRDNRIYITSQNHGFAVEPTTCPKDEIEIIGLNVNDGTVEALQHRTLPIFSVQYHPEASPGPWDNKYLFDRFVEQCLSAKI
jgi:carbamoyl-phosphate synthase small subunit